MFSEEEKNKLKEMDEKEKSEEYMEKYGLWWVLLAMILFIWLVEHCPYLQQLLGP